MQVAGKRPGDTGLQSHEQHRSDFAPVRSPRLIRWMMAEEYFERQPMRWVFERVGVILVDRGNRDMASICAAMRVLAAGYVLGVFPEGRIEITDEIIPFQSGIGLLAMKTLAPVYPGVSRWFPTRAGDDRGILSSERNIHRIRRTCRSPRSVRLETGGPGSDSPHSVGGGIAERRVKDLETRACVDQYFLSLRIGQGKAKLVDDLRSHADPFRASSRRNFFVDEFSLGVAERRAGHFAGDASAAIAGDLSFADRLRRSCGDGSGGNGRTQFLQHFRHFILRHHVATRGGDLDSTGQGSSRL